MKENELPEEELGSEYGGDDWLILDVDGHEICNSRDRPRDEEC